MISVDNTDPTPPFEQIRRQLVDEIRSGTLPQGSKLPSVRQLAGDLSVAAGTVARAYGELESEGLVETSKTGTRVLPNEHLPKDLRNAAGRFVRSVPSATLEDALRAVRAEWGLH
jgi:DNA-binding transcriptional regulator YhcF (GntR family)